MVIDPSKVKRSKLRRPRFSVVYFRSPHYQEGLLDENLAWNQIIHSLTPLCNMIERTLQKSCFWGFSGRRLRVSEPENLACKGRRLWLWTRDSGLPNSVFTRVVQASVASPESLKKDSKTPRSLHQVARDSDLYRPESPGDTGDSGLQSPETPGLVDPNG
jgi:hypothetical protein